MPRNVIKITRERNKTHGNFENVAAMSQGLLAVLAASQNWGTLSEARRESIFLISHKLARIVSGDPDHADHWDDIGGYAELGKNDGQRPKKVRVALAGLKQRVAKVKARATRKVEFNKVIRKTKKKKVKARPAKKAARVVARSPRVRARAPVTPLPVKAPKLPRRQRAETAPVPASQAAAGV
jgi:hypothetical protein